MLPASSTRVTQHAPAGTNEKIHRQTLSNLEHFAAANPEKISQRLEEIEREWDIERALEANAGFFALFGLAMGTWVNKKFYSLSAVVAGFLFQHALQGWCPPLPVLRKLGFRTRHEIDQERYALKFIRGDFQGLPQPSGKENREKANLVLDAVAR